MTCTCCEAHKLYTGLTDTLGLPIMVGHVVHWTDGGDDLPLEERIRTRWDRIAVVRKIGIMPNFKVIDSPSERTKAAGHSFNYGCFIYQDTENYLTIVAGSPEEYFKKFVNAGECMAWVKTARANYGVNSRKQNIEAQTGPGAADHGA